MLNGWYQFGGVLFVFLLLFGHSALRGLALLQSSFGLSTSKLRRYFSVLPANSDLSSPSLMATFTRRIQRNYVERYALVVYRQSSCIELSFDAHFLEFVALSLVWAESFERQDRKSTRLNSSHTV